MKKTFIHLMVIFVVFSCSTRKIRKMDSDNIKQLIDEQGDIIKRKALLYFEEIPRDSLYGIILNRYAPDDYPIKFLFGKKIEFDVFSVPYFTLLKDNFLRKGYVLTPDTTYVFGFLLYNNQPFAQFFLDYVENKEMLRQTFTQGVSKELWQHYQNLIDKGYPVFMCNLKIKDAQSDGTLFLPFIFYIDHQGEIFAFMDLTNNTITMEEVLQKIP